MTPVVSADTIDAAWIGERLREAGHPGVRVKGLRAARIGTGQIGKCIRYELDLEDADPQTPRSLVAKFASDDPASRQTGLRLGSFVKEVSFYRELQGRLRIRTPRCYAAEIDGIGPDFVLLLEDLAPAAQGDQLRGCSEAVARAAVQELVGLHAPSWCDASLRGVEWLGEPGPEAIALGRALYRAQLPGFLSRYGARLAPDEARIVERVAEGEGAPFEPLGDVFSLVHVDYRLDNLLIDESASPPRVAVVDWQSITLGRPLADVAYFLGAGLLPERRRALERAIVADYHDALVSAGVEGFGWADCWREYRRGAFAGFGVTVIASMMVEQTERGDAMFVAMARRHARHALDLGSEEFLS